MSLRNILQNSEADLSRSPAHPASPIQPYGIVDDDLGYTRRYRRASTAASIAETDVALSKSSTNEELRDIWDVWQVRTANTTYPPAGMERKPRAPRPSYSEEQKFYIMFCRVICDLTWPEIEENFSNIFGGRTKGGLTSIYYRVRKDWGLCEVLKSGPQSIATDHDVVVTKASNFSAEFLKQIGYLDKSKG